MASVLLYVAEGEGGDARQIANSYQRGDVIAVRPDDHQWGAEEGVWPFAVVPVPGITVETLAPLAVPDPYEVNDEPNPVWRLRRYRIDMAVLASLLADVPAWLALLEDGGQDAAMAAGLIAPVAIPPPAGA